MTPRFGRRQRHLVAQATGRRKRLGRSTIANQLDSDHHALLPHLADEWALTQTSSER